MHAFYNNYRVSHTSYILLALTSLCTNRFKQPIHHQKSYPTPSTHTLCRDAKQIYECFVELSGPTDSTEAQIRFVYPKDYEWEEDTRKQIPKFTFPTRTSKWAHCTCSCFILTKSGLAYMWISIHDCSSCNPSYRSVLAWLCWYLMHCPL